MTAPFDDQLAALFPLGGPYDDATTVAAARSIAGLVRYLNHASQHADAVSGPATVDAVVVSLAGELALMDQTLRQMDDRIWALAARPGAYVTSGETPAEAARIISRAVDDARFALDQAQGHLTVAGKYTSRIGLDIDQE